jgi:hypothetical protein
VCVNVLRVVLALQVCVCVHVCPSRWKPFEFSMKSAVCDAVVARGISVR